MRTIFLYSVAALLSLCLCACETTNGGVQISGGFGTHPGDAVIPWAEQVGIWNWQAMPDDRTVFIEDMHDQWYRAELANNACVGLHLAPRLALTFEPNGDFDRFSMIRYHDQSCPLASLTRIASPPGSVAPPAQSIEMDRTAGL